MHKGKAFVVLGVVALGVGLSIPAALAGKKKATTVVFNSGSPGLKNSGLVKASGSLRTSTACLATRGMKMFLLDDTNDSYLATLDSESSDTNGNWRLQGRLPTGLPVVPLAIQVKATKRTAGKAVCKAGFSSVVQIAAPQMSEEHADSTVTIKNTAPSTFKGRVTSDNDSCIKGRAVKLIQDGKAISQGITDKNGVWRVALEGKLTGDFSAKLKSKRVGSLLCEADKSPTITV